MNNNLVLSKKQDLFLVDNFPVLAGVTTRLFGDLSLNAKRDNNLAAILEADDFIRLKHQHDKKIVVLSSYENNYYVGDALIYQPSKEQNNPLLISGTADCPTLVVTDKSQSFLAVAHSGWRGVYLNIAQELVHLLRHRLKIAGSDIFVWLWPGICRHCYDVGRDMEKFFPRKIINRKLDLKKLIVEQLIAAGVKEANISSTSLCSNHSSDGQNHLFSSYRRDGTTERNVVFARFNRRKH